MGRLTYETYNPNELEFPNDIDFELEGIDEEYEEFQEYVAYLPDRIAQLRPMDSRAVSACRSASNVLASVCSHLAASDVADVVARLLLYAEAVATVRIEGYQATCTAMLDYAAVSSVGGAFLLDEAEETATDALDALCAFVCVGKNAVTLDDLCDADACFARSNSRAEYCGELRERPVFIGRSLFDAEYVPPPADTLDDYMDDLVCFINARDGVDPIAKAAIAHAQFITIHPFEDGNGRTGRAIAQRVLCAEKVTRGFVLPSAVAMAAHKLEYIDVLQCTQSSSGPSDPSRFIMFFAACCEDAARQALVIEQQVEDVMARWTSVLPTTDAAVQKAMRLFAATPIMTEAMLPEDARAVLDDMLCVGILQKRRSAYGGVDIYVADDILKLAHSYLV